MSPSIQFYGVDLENLFSIIGSADRDLLLRVGAHPGSEFRESFDDDEEVFSETDDDEEEEEEAEGEFSQDWDYEEEELDSARAVITKMVMSELPGDLAEDEVQAVLEFIASYADTDGQLASIDADDLLEAVPGNKSGDDVAEFINISMVKGYDAEALIELVEWLQGKVAPEVATHMQMLAMGRLPYSEEPAVIEIEDFSGTRCAYLSQSEMAVAADDLEDLAGSDDCPQPTLLRTLAGIFHYCNANATDLFALIEE